MGSIANKFAALSIETTAEQEALLERYLDILLEYNSRFNLTAITSREDAIVKHLADSMAATAYIPQGGSLIDIGSGGGCPAIPLKIMRPDIALTMADSVGKKVNFLNTVIAELGITNACALHIRAEELARSDVRESFDVATARAVASLPILLELASPLIKTGGLFIAYKGENDEQAVAETAAKALQCRLIDKHTYLLDGQYHRTLFIYRKTAAVSRDYPRPFAQIQRRPL